MAFTSITATSAVGALQTSSDDSARETALICRRASKSAHNEQAERQINPLYCEKNSLRKTAKNEIKKIRCFSPKIRQITPLESVKRRRNGREKQRHLAAFSKNNSFRIIDIIFGK